MTVEMRGIYLCLAAGAVLLSVSMEVALWIVLQGGAELREHAMRLAEISWWGVLAMTIVLALATYVTDPGLQQRFEVAPWGYAFPVIALAGLFGVRASKVPQMEFLAFFFSGLYLVGAAASAIFGTLL